MMTFFRLPNELCLLVFKDWLEYADLSALDIAAGHSVRTDFLALLADVNPSADFLNNWRIDHALASNPLPILLEWTISRHVQVQSLNIFLSDVISSHISTWTTIAATAAASAVAADAADAASTRDGGGLSSLIRLELLSTNEQEDDPPMTYQIAMLCGFFDLLPGLLEIDLAALTALTDVTLLSIFTALASVAVRKLQLINLNSCSFITEMHLPFILTVFRLTLTSFHADALPLSAEILTFMGQICNLDNLTLNCSTVGDALMEHFRFPAMKRLTLVHNEELADINHANAILTEISEDCKQLTNLDVSQFVEQCTVLADIVRNCPHLKEVYTAEYDLHKPAATAAVWEAYVHTVDPENMLMAVSAVLTVPLCSFELGGSLIADDDIVCRISIMCQKHLRRLKMAVDASEVCLHLLFSRLPLIEEMLLYGCNSLTDRIVCDNNLSDWTPLHQGNDFKRITKLALTEAQMNDDAMIALLSSLPHLEELNVDDCSLLTDETLQAIDQYCPMVTKLSIYGTAMSAEAIWECVHKKMRVWQEVTVSAEHLPWLLEQLVESGLEDKKDVFAFV